MEFILPFLNNEAVELNHNSLSQFAMLRHRDDKAKDQTFINSKQAASVPNQCHKCNEIGHPTQFCPVDKHHMTAMTPSSDRSLRVMDNRSIKQKNAFEILSWKLGTKRKSPEQFEEVSLAHADVNSEETTKTFAAVRRNMPFVESTMDVQDFRKEAITIQRKLNDNKKSVGVPGSETDLDFANDLAAMPVIQNLSDQASIEIDLMRTSVIPEINYIWQYGILLVEFYEFLKSLFLLLIQICVYGLILIVIPYYVQGCF